MTIEFAKKSLEEAKQKNSSYWIKYWQDMIDTLSLPREPVVNTVEPVKQEPVKDVEKKEEKIDWGLDKKKEKKNGTR